MKKGNNSLTLLVIILLIIVLGLTFYIVYDKMLNNGRIQSYGYDLSKRTTVQAARQDNIEVLVDTDGNAYLYMIDDLDNESNLQIKTNLKNIEKRFKTYSPKGYRYIDGSHELKAYKLDISNVLTVYYVHKGNGGFSYFIFVKDNGKLAYLSYDKLIYDGEIEIKDIENIENVVSIVENTYSMTPYVITSNGSELSLYDYIK